MESPEDLEAFCRHEYPRLTRLIDAQLGDLHVAEEIAQEALLRAARDWKRVSTLQSPGGWAHRVALNLTASWWRRQQAARRASRRHGPNRLDQADPDTPMVLAIRAALSQLPRRQRAAVLLRHHAGFSVAETAAAMQLTDNAVRSLTKRGLAALRAQLAEDDRPLRSDRP